MQHVEQEEDGGQWGQTRVSLWLPGHTVCDEFSLRYSLISEDTFGVKRSPFWRRWRIPKALAVCSTAVWLLSVESCTLKAHAGTYGEPG